ncbi:4-(cytidine 5'-diphospho)-2-C-methyl-D-erythritol kinase [Streptomyces sp. NPDC021749]|uniref:4-(cytidine 5'-diphospho)-2-C-methyl-D-erythritol kinase n=1 Tax=Streptomyces sp. NPDC021749 TaxID=3154905 RepID=UPI00340CD02F
MTAVTVRAPAKINLQLAVGARREDGFHELATVYLAVGLYDEVSAAPADAMTVAVEGGESAGVPVDSTNLVARAASRLASRTGRAPGVRLRIRKNIPVAAGLAGGSADAAAALLACDKLWGTRLPHDELRDLCAELGSDVPFILNGGVAVGTGRGERLAQVAVTGDFHRVLAFGQGGLSTPAVYQEYDRLRHPTDPGRRPVIDEVILRALRQGDVRALAAALGGRGNGNELAAAAISLRPELGNTLTAGVGAGALAAFVSGSGPTCVFLAEDARAAERVVHGLMRSGTCRAARAVAGPVPGAAAAAVEAG